ncbi:MAG: CCA tRNA nucleotidyltransferase [Armatimonadota bacterium]
MNRVIEKLRRATQNSPYAGRLYLVGGIVRDKFMGIPPDEDIDIVLEGDAAGLANFLHERGVADYRPVTFARFGTAMIIVDDRQVEIVGARKESYDASSRKPITQPGTLADDAARRDFTINTLLENLHTGEVLDLTGQAERDIRDGIIRTPVDPIVTFNDDPLRMLRAIRFASRFGFKIDEKTYSAIYSSAHRLSIVSQERIKDEFLKILMSAGMVRGLEMLRETGLLAIFAPELTAMHGVTQNIYHIYDVWTHSLKTLESIPAEAGIIMRLAALMHDIGKVEARSVAPDGAVHFYNHAQVGAKIAHRIMRRLKFSNSQIAQVEFLISMHLRVGEYDKQWTDAAVRRLIREADHHLDDLIMLTQADKSASNTDMPSVDLDAFCEHVARVKTKLAGHKITSPLDGREIIELLGIDQGPKVGEVKAYLEREIIEGNLLAGDKAGAAELIGHKFGVIS